MFTSISRQNQTLGVDENLLNIQVSVCYTECPNKNATFLTKLKTIAFCSDAKIFFDSERI